VLPSSEATRSAGNYVSRAKDQLIADVTTAIEAVQYVTRTVVENDIDYFVDKALSCNPMLVRIVDLF
jgi:hypothetical protein